jgi:hypothetical protein
MGTISTVPPILVASITTRTPTGRHRMRANKVVIRKLDMEAHHTPLIRMQVTRDTGTDMEKQAREGTEVVMDDVASIDGFCVPLSKYLQIVSELD